MTTYTLRDHSGRTTYRLRVRDASDAEARSTPHGPAGVVEILPARARRPALTVVVGAPACDLSDHASDRAEEIALVCTALAFASTPSAWDDPAEIEAAETHGTAAEEAAWGHAWIGRALSARMG